MDKSTLIWSLLLAVVLLGEYRAWTRTTTPAPWWRIALWIGAGFCGWSITIGLGRELLFQLIGLLLLLLQASLVALPAIWIHYCITLRSALEDPHE